MSELSERLCLNLSYSLAGDIELASYLFKRMDDVLKNPSIWREMYHNYETFIELLKRYD